MSGHDTVVVRSKSVCSTADQESLNTYDPVLYRIGFRVADLFLQPSLIKLAQLFQRFERGLRAGTLKRRQFPLQCII